MNEIVSEVKFNPIKFDKIDDCIQPDFGIKEEMTFESLATNHIMDIIND